MIISYVALYFFYGGLNCVRAFPFSLAWCSLMMAAVAKTVVRARRLRVTGVVLMPHGV